MNFPTPYILIRNCYIPYPCCTHITASICASKSTSKCSIDAMKPNKHEIRNKKQPSKKETVWMHKPSNKIMNHFYVSYTPFD